MPTTFRLNPERVAYFETNGWRAYYERKWLKVLWLIVRLCQEQFHVPFPMSLLAAYYTTRASAAWAPLCLELYLAALFFSACTFSSASLAGPYWQWQVMPCYLQH
ncbi:MAG: hypothetical protein E6J33_05435 [Chloroflexi bacterium]|nr:MAG: hypothetical protein E6J33_05435 [Chloroflexota bacterium]